MIDRRFIISGILALPFASTAAGQDPVAPPEDVDASGMERLDALPPGFEDGLGKKANSLSVNFGSATPPPVYGALATALLEGAPVDCRPVDVAYYFNAVRERRFDLNLLDRLTTIATRAKAPELARPEFLSIFAYDWERNRYFNPVVVGFLRGIGAKPYAGDQTPWCAAFANWCISRSRTKDRQAIAFGGSLLAYGTSSASSGSFRCWGTRVETTPREGDIVVWAKRGTQGASCPAAAQGHVGFVSGVEGTGASTVFKVVGGNQGFRGRPSADGRAVVAATDVAQAVSYRRIGASFSDRVLHSARTKAFLR